MSAGPLAAGSGFDRLARAAERLLRIAADPRLGAALLLLTAVGYGVSTVLANGGALLQSPPFLALLGGVLAAGLAAVAVRAPTAWREWRRPSPPPEGGDTLARELRLAAPADDAGREKVAAALRAAGYRVGGRPATRAWSVAAVRRGWARFAGVGSHAALVLLVLGAAVGTAFSAERTFSLLPGQQALLDTPRPGLTDAVRLDDFQAEFGADGRPLRLDAHVSFLRDGRLVERQLIQVNQPGAFGDYLVHGWTYGPAARLRVTSLGGQPLLDAPLALDRTVDGRPTAFAELPEATLTLAVQLVDATANQVTVSLGGGQGALDAIRLTPGEEGRLGPLLVRLDGLDAYLTFVSRRDPGMGIVLAGAALLCASLAVALWLPRRRLGLRTTPTGLRLTLRGERFDDPGPELERLAARLASVLPPAGDR